MTRTVFFEAWRGRYADSPRSISEALSSSHPELKQWWTTTDGRPPRSGVRAVTRHSASYSRQLLSTDLLITNDVVTKHLVKGPRVTYVQCCHGTPLKVVAHDEVGSTYSGAAAHLRRVDRDVKKWDYLLSPSPTITRILRRAYQYEGVVLETGNPRNDLLVTDDGSVRSRVRRSLGIAEETLAVLYAPTWRDNSKDEHGRFVQSSYPDFEKLDAALDNAVVLSRLHPNVSGSIASVPGFTIDVSSYEELGELFLAADVFVSDYSSAIFDFAVTGKPIVLFAPDLERYRNDIRPLYFDYESWAPGPIISTTAHLAEAMRDLDSVHSAFVERRADFTSRFSPYDDGNATARVVEAILG